MIDINASCEIFGFVDTNDNSRTSLLGIFLTEKFSVKLFLKTLHQYFF